MNEQLSLFGDEHRQLPLPEDNFNDLPEEILDLNSGADEDREVSAKPELLTIRLFKRAIREAKGNRGDRLLETFAENVLPNLIDQLVGTTAKGGQFTEARRAEGKNVERSKHDQSFISHLLNGLFPTYRIVKKLKTLETNQVKRLCGELEISIFIASYILHDFDKLPDYSAWLVANDPQGKFKDRNWRKQPAKKSDAPNLGRGYVAQKVKDFGLDVLLGDDCESYIDDLVWISNNAGVKYDADLGMESRGLSPKLDGRVRGILSRLVRLSDLFASVIKHPADIEEGGLADVLLDLSNGQLKFSYHALSDNRGVLTNILNNALMEVHPEEFYTPLLYLPDGVVYLASSDAAVDVTSITTQIIAKIKTLCAERLKKRQTGFSRDGKGFKFADYYWLFFSLEQFMKVSVDAACRIIPSTKSSSAKKRSDSLLLSRHKIT